MRPNNSSIANAVNHPVKVAKNLNKYTNNTATLYYIDDIHYVAIDDATRKVIQVADMNDMGMKSIVHK